MKPTNSERTETPAVAVQRLVRRLYETRKDAKQAKTARRELTEKIGGCEYHDPTASDEDAGLPCHYSHRPKEKWCDICKQKLPLWEDYHHKTNLAAAALRELIRVGATLPPNGSSSPTAGGGSGGAERKT